MVKLCIVVFIIFVFILIMIIFKLLRMVRIINRLYIQLELINKRTELLEKRIKIRKWR